MYSFTDYINMLQRDGKTASEFIPLAAPPDPSPQKKAAWWNKKKTTHAHPNSVPPPAISVESIFMAYWSWAQPIEHYINNSDHNLIQTHTDLFVECMIQSQIIREYYQHNKAVFDELVLSNKKSPIPAINSSILKTADLSKGPLKSVINMWLEQVNQGMYDYLSHRIHIDLKSRERKRILMNLCAFTFVAGAAAGITALFVTHTRTDLWISFIGALFLGLVCVLEKPITRPPIDKKARPLVDFCHKKTSSGVAWLHRYDTLTRVFTLKRHAVDEFKQLIFSSEKPVKHTIEDKCRYEAFKGDIGLVLKHSNSNTATQKVVQFVSKSMIELGTKELYHNQTAYLNMQPNQRITLPKAYTVS